MILSSNIRLITLLSMVFLAANTYAKDSVYYIGTGLDNIPGTYLEYSEITEANNQFENIEALPFQKNSKSMLNLGITSKAFWVKLRLFNHREDSMVRIDIPVAYTDSVILYYPVNGRYEKLVSGELIKNTDRPVDDPHISFIIPVNPEITTIYFRVRSHEQLIFPINVIPLEYHFTTRNIFFGIFSGMILALFLYNLMLAFLLREQVYYMYLIFLFSIYFAQAELMGISYFFFGGWPTLNHLSVYVFSAFVGLSALRFMEKFLVLQVNMPKSQKYVNLAYFLYLMLLITAVVGYQGIAYLIMQISGMYAATLALTISTKLSIRGNILAKFYLAAWSIFTLGIFIFVLKDYSILPYNNFTKLTMPFGVMIEVVLLSIALAHRINTLKKDNEKAQERIIEEMSRNENLIKNQNVILEDKVKQRTEELEHTLTNLKQAQVKLIESEKMASLGLLTAGIAHEINNPINYVTANVIPLRDNIKYLGQLISEYKSLTPENFDEKISSILKLEEEIELDYTLTETSELIDGIEEGAKRTYNIVDGLRTFSRSDKTAKKISDINKGVRSTLSVLKSQLNSVPVKTEFDSSLPEVNCQLGKLNQVFLNLINNAIHALEEKYANDMSKALLTIKTYQDDSNVYVEVIDNGSGISKDALNKIFEPFYTSKPIGKGTGLGLSISYAIIEDHNGELSVTSEEGKGSSFVIRLPK